jgi:hypothetical protein
MSAGGSDSEPAAKRTKQCVPSAGADSVAPLGTSTMPPLWLEQGHALRTIDELKKRRRRSDAPRGLNADTSLFRRAACELSGKFRPHLKYEIPHHEIIPSQNPPPPVNRTFTYLQTQIFGP